jgi:hypothetical protein
MNTLNSSAISQRTVPPEYIPPMSLHRFCEITGFSKVSAWRFEKRGWLRTHLIANRRYILAEDVAEFNRKIAAGEFVGKVADLPAFEKRDTVDPVQISDKTKADSRRQLTPKRQPRGNSHANYSTATD